MDTKSIVEKINNRAELYKRVSKKIFEVISDINKESKYKIALFEEQPNFLIEIKELGVSKRFKPTDVTNREKSKGSEEDEILYIINNAIDERKK